jgi:hypothetical protein
VLGVLLAAGWLALSVAGTAVLALRSAAMWLQQLMYSVNQCYRVVRLVRWPSGRR